MNISDEQMIEAVKTIIAGCKERKDCESCILDECCAWYWSDDDAPSPSNWKIGD